MNPNVLAVCCARETGERFPGKCLETIGTLPVLAHIFARLEQAESVRQVVLAIPDGQGQNRLRHLAVEFGIPVIAGPEHDVVARMDLAVKRHAREDDLVFRVMTDQPFLDWNALDTATAVMIGHKWDFVLPLTFNEDPVYGGGIHPWSLRAWQAIAQQSRNDELEHPGMWLRRNLAKWQYGLADLPHWMYRPYRLELDMPQDLELFRVIHAAWTGETPPPLRWVVRFLDRNPSVAAMNASVHEKTGTYISFSRAEIDAWYRDYAEREIVWSEVGMSGSMELKAERGRRAFRCGECGCAMMALSITSKNDLLTRCVRCGEKRTFYASVN